MKHSTLTSLLLTNILFLNTYAYASKQPDLIQHEYTLSISKEGIPKLKYVAKSTKFSKEALYKIQTYCNNRENGIMNSFEDNEPLKQNTVEELNQKRQELEIRICQPIL